MGIEVTRRDNIFKDTEKYKEISSKSADIPKDLHFIILLNGCNRFSRKIYFSIVGISQHMRKFWNQSQVTHNWCG